MKVYKEAEKNGIDIKTLPVPEPVIKNDLFACKYCDRKFNEQAIKKH